MTEERRGTVVRRIVVAEVPEPYRLGAVDVLPFRSFLERLPRLVR